MRLKRRARRQCAPEPLLGRLKCWSANEAEGVYWVRVRVCRCRIGGGGRVGEGVTSSSRFCEVAKDEGEVMVRAHHLGHREVDKGVALAVVVMQPRLSRVGEMSARTRQWWWWKGASGCWRDLVVASS